MPIDLLFNRAMNLCFIFPLTIGFKIKKITTGNPVSISEREFFNNRFQILKIASVRESFNNSFQILKITSVRVYN